MLKGGHVAKEPSLLCPGLQPGAGLQRPGSFPRVEACLWVWTFRVHLARKRGTLRTAHVGSLVVVRLYGQLSAMVTDRFLYLGLAGRVVNMLCSRVKSRFLLMEQEWCLAYMVFGVGLCCPYKLSPFWFSGWAVMPI